MTSIWSLFLGCLLISTIASGSRCVFPSLIRRHESAIRECQFSNHWWCPTSQHYFKDKRRISCPQTSSTMGGNDPGKQCAFPFRFNSHLYSSCIQLRERHHTVQNQSHYWCSTTKDFNTDRKWTLCKPSSPHLPCHFEVDKPGINKECWAVDSKWTCITKVGRLRECPDTDLTVGGNDPGKDCHLPFLYRKTTYKRCISDALDRKGGKESFRWCSTTPDYDKDGKWTRCRDYKRVRGLQGLLLILVILVSVFSGVIFLVFFIYYWWGRHGIRRKREQRRQRLQRSKLTRTTDFIVIDRTRDPYSDTITDLNDEECPSRGQTPPPPYNETMMIPHS